MTEICPGERAELLVAPRLAVFSALAYVGAPVASIGSHCMLEMYGCRFAVLDDAELVRTAVRQAAVESRSTLLQEVAHRFEPQGVTVLGLLAESHISVHTWPELGYAAADIFTCGTACDPVAACRYLAKALGAENFELREVERGMQPPASRPQRVPAQLKRV